MIEAAGGVLLRAQGRRRDVLVVHRVIHQDWSLPKGKLDPGETPEQAAVREVAEETGITASIIAPLHSVEYEVAQGPKRVRWYLMAPEGGSVESREPDGEVDRVEWWEVDRAVQELEYDLDREVLVEALALTEQQA